MPDSTIQSFEEQARAMRAQAAERMPAAMQAATQQLIQDLEATLVTESLQEGDLAPDFALQSATTGETVRLSEALQRGPAVLSFYRGQWCPYCNLEVRSLESIHEPVRELGGEIYLIGPETVENARKLQEKTGSSIPILTDVDGDVCDAYRLAFELPASLQSIYATAGMDLPQANPATGWMLPIPATFVVDPGQRIVSRFVNADYTRRMEPADVLAAVRGAQRVAGAEPR